MPGKLTIWGFIVAIVVAFAFGHGVISLLSFSPDSDLKDTQKWGPRLEKLEKDVSKLIDLTRLERFENSIAELRGLTSNMARQIAELQETARAENLPTEQPNQPPQDSE